MDKYFHVRRRITTKTTTATIIVKQEDGKERERAQFLLRPKFCLLKYFECYPFTVN